MDSKPLEYFVFTLYISSEVAMLANTTPPSPSRSEIPFIDTDAQKTDDTYTAYCSWGGGTGRILLLYFIETYFC